MPRHATKTSFQKGQPAWNKKYSSSKDQYRKVRKAVVALLGGQCSNPDCRHLNEDGTLGCKEECVLHIDHPNNDGSVDRKKHGTSGFLYHVLRMKGEGYRLLCATCNWRRRYEGKDYAS